MNAVSLAASIAYAIVANVRRNGSRHPECQTLEYRHFSAFLESVFSVFRRGCATEPCFFCQCKSLLRSQPGRHRGRRVQGRIKLSVWYLSRKEYRHCFSWDAPLPGWLVISPMRFPWAVFIVWQERVYTSLDFRLLAAWFFESGEVEAAVIVPNIMSPAQKRILFFLMCPSLLKRSSCLIFNP